MSTAAPLRSQPAKSQPTSNASHASLLLQRKCACGSPTASLTGECAECASKKRLQTKLTIGASNDPLELEADRVADQVMAAPAHSPVRGAPPHIQRYTAQPGEGAGVAPASVDRVLASPGKPLEPVLRRDMEQRFGHDFSRVRVHTGGAAEQSARDLSANAYTVGRDIVFGAGRFASASIEERRLIAHELTHVVQQSDTNGPRGRDGGEYGLSPIFNREGALFSGADWTAGDAAVRVVHRVVQREGAFDVPTLGQMYDRAIQAARATGNWQDAAEKLNGFNREDILNRLALLTDEEVGYMYGGAVDNPRVGPDSQLAQMSKPGTPRASTMGARSSQVKATDRPVLSGVMKVGNTVIGDGELSSTQEGGKVSGGEVKATGPVTLNGEELFGGITFAAVLGGTPSGGTDTGRRVVKAVWDVASKDPALKKESAKIMWGVGAQAARVGVGSILLRAGAGAVASVLVAALMLVVAGAISSASLRRRNEFGGASAPGGLAHLSVDEPDKPGEAYAPGGDAGAPAYTPGTSQGGPAIAPGVQDGPAAAPGQSNTPAQLGSGSGRAPDPALGKIKPPEIPEETHGLRKSPGGAPVAEGKEVGNWVHNKSKNFERLPELIPNVPRIISNPVPPDAIPEYPVKRQGYSPGREPRIDRLDRASGTVIEIKPHGLYEEGLAEAKVYAQDMDMLEPLPNGQKWRARCVTYDYDAVLTYLRKVGYLE